MLDNLTNSFKGVINKIKFYDDEKALKKILANLKKDLLKSDVHFKVCKALLDEIEKETKINGIGKESFIKAIEKSLSHLFEVAGNYGFVYSPKPPTIVLMMGLQGAGKTTTTMKLAH